MASPTSPNLTAQPIEDGTDHLNNNNGIALTQSPSILSPPPPPSQPSAPTSTTPPGSPPQPFVPGNLPGAFPVLRNSAPHNPHSPFPGTPFQSGSIDAANASPGFRGSVGEYRGLRFSTNRTGAPPPHAAPANLRIYIDNPAPNRSVSTMLYQAPTNTHPSGPTPYTSFARMPAPGFNYPKTFVHVMRPDGTRTGQFSVQFENAEKEAEGLEYVRPWLEGGGRLYPKNWKWQAVCGNRRVAILEREDDEAVEGLLR